MAVKRSIVERLTSQIQAQGKSKKDAQAIAVARLRNTGSLKKNGAGLTAKGKEKQALGAAGRAKQRAADKLNRKPSDFKYNPRTNRATLKK
jgi:hypothetical protein